MQQADMLSCCVLNIYLQLMVSEQMTEETLGVFG